ncbi:MAG: hypothetical protein WCP55_08475 [Lentisphaerota bacterium]
MKLPRKEHAKAVNTNGSFRSVKRWQWTDDGWQWSVIRGRLGIEE